VCAKAHYPTNKNYKNAQKATLLNKIKLFIVGPTTTTSRPTTTTAQIATSTGQFSELNYFLMVSASLPTHKNVHHDLN
jgi:hypothetical protein